MKNIQTNLLSAFESSGLTYDELAKRTNLPKSAIHRYLNGDTEKIPIDRFQAICSELHVDAGSLLGWTDDHPVDLCMLPDVESNLILSFRSLSPRGQDLLLDRAEELKLLYGKKTPDDSVKSV